MNNSLSHRGFHKTLVAMLVFVCVAVFQFFQNNRSIAGFSCPDLSFTLTPSTQSVTTNTSITNILPTPARNGYTFTISPALPAGLNLDTTTGIISGTPTSTSPLTTYDLTLTPNVCLPTDSTFGLEVTNPVTPPAPAPIPDPAQNSTQNSYSPNHGPITGGTVVKVLGNFPDPIANILVDDKRLDHSAYMQTLTEVDITMPPHPVGSVKFQIFNGHVPVLVPLDFTYEPVPTPEPAPLPTPTPAPQPTPTPEPKKTLELRVGFHFDKYDITARVLKILQNLDLTGFHTVTLSGYAQDNQWQGDLALSVHRAAEVRSILRALHPGIKFTVEGFGKKYNPLCDRYINKCVVIDAT